MKISIRKANKKDVASVVALNTKITDFHHTLDKYYPKASEKTEKFVRRYFLKDVRKRNCLTLLAEADGNIVGYYEVLIKKIPHPFIAPDRVGYICDAFIEKEYRRKSIGKKMFDEVMRWFRKHKLKHIELSVHAKNEIGKNAWKKYGFKEDVRKMRLDL